MNPGRILARLRAGDAGFAALLAARALQIGGSLAVTVLIVWRYGLPSAGLYALASVPASLGSLAVGFGLPNALPRSGASDGGRATLGLALSTAACVPVAAACIAYASLVAPDATVPVACLAMAGALVGQVNVQQTLYVLHRRPLLAPVAPGVHLAGAVLAAAAPDFATFAVALLVSRALGCVAGFVPLAYARASRADLAEATGAGSRFAPVDVACLLSEQVPILVLDGMLGRSEVGLYGLVRQFVAVADTPGWSYVLSRYPEMVAQPVSGTRSVARGNARLGWACGLGTLAAASAMALAVYRLPALVPLLFAPLLAVPARYLNNLCDQSLRASGHVWDCMALALAKVALSLALSAGLAALFGLPGAVAALALLSVASALAYRARLLAVHPGSVPSLSALAFPRAAGR